MPLTLADNYFARRMLTQVAVLRRVLVVVIVVLTVAFMLMTFQVTNSTDRSMELRCLMSSADSSQNFDLRCHVRERLIAYIQKNYPEGLPRVRTELGQVGSAGEQPNKAVLRAAADESEGRAA